MPSGNSRRRQANVAWPSASTVLAGCLAAALSVLLDAKAVYVAATFGMDARKDWRIAGTLPFAALSIVAWRRWKRRRS